MTDFRRSVNPSVSPDRDARKIREEFPILRRFVYLISNSLGAVPKTARNELEEFYGLWKEEGVRAWEKAWWNLGLDVGNLVARLLGAPAGTVIMTTNATQAHWVALSTCFGKRGSGRRNKVILSDQDFPSILYAAEGICRAMGWNAVFVPSRTGAFDPEPLLEAIDERTLFVATSHVHYKTAFLQDVEEICRRARRKGALSLIDGYHAPGVVPVDVRRMGADFYVGGCLKWLCGGPGTAFLYVRPETALRFRPVLRGWAGHRDPFRFGLKFEGAEGSRGFQSGTPPVPCLYTARAGLRILRGIGPAAIRARSLGLTQLIITRARERGFPLLTPAEKDRRGGHVAFHVPHTLAVKLALEARNILTDFRKGERGEPDVLRIGPHVYNTDEEIEVLFYGLDEILSKGAYRPFLRARPLVT